MPFSLNSVHLVLCSTWALLCWHASGQVISSCGTSMLTFVDNAKAPYCTECVTVDADHCADGANVNMHGTCTTLCQDGYTAFPSSLTCTNTGLSPRTFECIPQPCQATGIAYAQSPPCLHGVPVPHEGNCTLLCIDGFAPKQEMSDCYASKLLPFPECVGLPCKAPVGIEHAQTPSCHGNKSSVAHGSYCSSACMPGYTANVSKLDCFGTVLTPLGFSCSPSPCSAPYVANAPEISCVEGSSIPHGGICTPQCLFGFSLSYTAPLQCNLGELLPETWACIPMSCPDFDTTAIPMSASATCEEGPVIPHNGFCTSQCEAGYLSSGPLKCFYGALTPPKNCSDFDCPPEMVLYDDAENLYCSLPWCSLFDVDTCCRARTTTTRTTLTTTTATTSTTSTSTSSTTTTSTSTATVTCADTSDGARDRFGSGCEDYFINQNWCSSSAFDTDDFTASLMCCACGGGNNVISTQTFTTSNTTTFTTTTNIFALGEAPRITLQYTDESQTFELQGRSHNIMRNGIIGWLDEPFTYEDIPEELVGAALFAGPFFLNLSIPPETCETEAGDTCVFPFIYKDVSYDSCTIIDRGKPWCATSLTSSLVVATWGECGASCYTTTYDRAGEGAFCGHLFAYQSATDSPELCQAWCSHHPDCLAYTTYEKPRSHSRYFVNTTSRTTNTTTTSTSTRSSSTISTSTTNTSTFYKESITNDTITNASATNDTTYENPFSHPNDTTVNATNDTKLNFNDKDDAINTTITTTTTNNTLQTLNQTTERRHHYNMTLKTTNTTFTSSTLTSTTNTTFFTTSNTTITTRTTYERSGICIGCVAYTENDCSPQHQILTTCQARVTSYNKKQPCLVTEVTLNTQEVKHSQLAAEISWQISDHGQIVCSSAGPYDNNQAYASYCCLKRRVYELKCIDDYGDGWNGGYMLIDGRRFCTSFTSGALRSETIDMRVQATTDADAKENATSATATRIEPHLTLVSPVTVVVYIWGESSGLRRDGGIKSLGWTKAGTMTWVDQSNMTELDIYSATFPPSLTRKINFPRSNWVGGVAIKPVPTPYHCIPQPCEMPSVGNASDPPCAEGRTILHGGKCTVMCRNGFVPTIGILSCNASLLTPSTFTCIGAPCNALATVPKAAWPSCAEGVQVDHLSTCTPLCGFGYIATINVLTCAFSQLDPPTFQCVELPCYPPGASPSSDVCSSAKVGSLAKINAGTSWYISMALFGDNRQAVCYEDVSAEQRYSYCGVMIAVGATITKPSYLVQVSPGRATDIVLAPLGLDQVLLCYRSYAQSSAGVCRVLATGSVLASIVGAAGPNDYREVTVGPELVVHGGITWRLAVAPIAPNGKAIVCYQHAFCSCRVVNVTGVTSSGVELSGSDTLSIGATSVVYLALASLGFNRAVLCVADAMSGEIGTCSILVADTVNYLSKGDSYRISDNSLAHMALAPLVRNLAMVCFADWSQSEHGKCRIIEASGHVIKWGKMFNITYQSTGSIRNLVSGVTRFMALAQLPWDGQNDLLWSPSASANGSLILPSLNESTDSGMGAVACFQISSSVQDRHGYCKVIRLTGYDDWDLSGSAEIILTTGTAWNFAVAPLSSGKVAVCFADSTESEHAHCNALVPGTGHNTWKDG